MTDRAALLALAARVEAAAEGERDLDLDIAALFGTVECRYPPGSIQAADGLWIIAYRAPHPYCGTREPVPAYTRDLNAALALVPEGWIWSLGGGDRLGHAAIWKWNGPMFRVSDATTPALALTAAALRARAAEEG